MKKYFNAAAAYLIFGLILGVFYREFTKIAGFTGETVLKGLHTHVLVLGFFFFIIVILVEKNFGLSKLKGATAWFITYNISFIYMIGTMIARGITEVKGTDIAGLSHMAGLSHVLLGVSLGWFMVLMNKVLKQNKAE